MAQPNYLTCKTDLLRGDIIYDVPLAYVSSQTRYLLKGIRSEHLKPGAVLPNVIGGDAEAVMRTLRPINLLVFTRSCVIEHPENYLGNRKPVLCYRIVPINKDLSTARLREGETVPCSDLDRCKNGELQGWFHLPPDDALGVSEGLVFFWEPTVADQSELTAGRKIARIAPALMAEIVAAREDFDEIKPDDFESDDPEDQVLAVRRGLGMNDVPYQSELFGVTQTDELTDDGA